MSTTVPPVPLTLSPEHNTPITVTPPPINAASHPPTLIPRDDTTPGPLDPVPSIVTRRSPRLRDKDLNTASLSTANPITHIIPNDDDGDDASSSRITTIADDFHLTTNPFGPSTIVTLPIKGTHPALGLHLIQHEDNNRILLHSCVPSTPAARIPRWRSTLHQSSIIAIDDVWRWH